jgi:hypothetical protein
MARETGSVAPDGRRRRVVKLVIKCLATWFFLAGAVLLWLSVDAPSVPKSVVAVSSLISGFGLLHERSWGKWFGIATSVFVLGWAVIGVIEAPKVQTEGEGEWRMVRDKGLVSGLRLLRFYDAKGMGRRNG